MPGIILGGRSTEANKRAKFLFSNIEINEHEANVIKKNNIRYIVIGGEGGSGEILNQLLAEGAPLWGGDS